jgi:hypothetical protein
MDLARSIQAVAEEVMLRMARHAHELTGERHLCLAGGVALNCVGNGRILREGPFEKIWIQPAAGDAGGALGAALLGWHHYHNKPRHLPAERDSQRGSFLGPACDAAEFLRRETIPHVKLSEDDLMSRVAELLEEGKVVGWFQGRMEFGPRALGNRSILGDPRRPDMQEKLNLKIKFRESFRPFAPSVLEERVNDCFELSEPSPYMLLVAPVKEALRVHGQNQASADFMTRLKSRRSTLPAVTHVDYSARVQTVAAADNPRFHRLLSQFEKRTGCPVLVNTSFNVRGEPPVCTSGDAYRCFMKTEMDYVVLGNYLLDKTQIRQNASRSGDFPIADQTHTVRQLPEKSPLFNEELQKLDCSIPALRRFAFTIAAVLVALGALMLWRHRTAGWPLLSLALLLLVLSILAPSSLRFVYRPWMMLALLLGSIASKILLTLAFFLVVTPIGLLQRLFGKRAFESGFLPDQVTYWKERVAATVPEEYERQF